MRFFFRRGATVYHSADRTARQTTTTGLRQSFRRLRITLLTWTTLPWKPTTKNLDASTPQLRHPERPPHPAQPRESEQSSGREIFPLAKISLFCGTFYQGDTQRFTQAGSLDGKVPGVLGVA